MSLNKESKTTDIVISYRFKLKKKKKIVPWLFFSKDGFGIELCSRYIFPVIKPIFNKLWLLEVQQSNFPFLSK